MQLGRYTMYSQDLQRRSGVYLMWSERLQLTPFALRHHHHLPPAKPSNSTGVRHPYHSTCDSPQAQSWSLPWGGSPPRPHTLSSWRLTHENASTSPCTATMSWPSLSRLEIGSLEGVGILRWISGYESLAFWFPVSDVPRTCPLCMKCWDVVLHS